MKKTALIIQILLILTANYAMSNTWKSYTNTTHIHDFDLINNKLYLATWGGLEEYNIEGSNFTKSNIQHSKKYNNINGLAGNDLRTVVHDPFVNSIWMSVYNQGINLLHDTGKITLIDQDLLGLPSNKVSKVIVDTLFYVATDNGLCTYDSFDNIPFPLLMSTYDDELLSTEIRDMELTVNGYLVIATSLGVNYVHKDSMDYSAAWHNWTFEGNQLPDNDVSSLDVYGEGVVIATLKGLVRVTGFPSNQEFSILSQFEELESPAISEVYIDSENRIWISFGSWKEESMSFIESQDYSIMVLNSDGTVLDTWKTNEEGLLSSDITAIKEIDNKICIATWGQGIFIREDGFWHQIIEESIGFNSIKSIETDKNNVLWFSSGVWADSKTKKGTRGVSSFDGETWVTYNVDNSPLNSDNINTIAVDALNRKWFGAWAAGSSNEFGWRSGISILDDSGDEKIWYRLNGNGLSVYDDVDGQFVTLDTDIGLASSTVPYILVDNEDNVIVSCFDSGMSIYSIADNSNNLEKIDDVRIESNPGQKTTYSVQSGDKYFFALNRSLVSDGEVYCWDNSGLPQSNSESDWSNVPISELRDCTMNSIVSFEDPFGRTQTWFAANTGLFTYIDSNQSDEGWYKWGTSIKREKWTGYTWTHQTYDLYYIDEERLFGANESEAFSLYYDPFGILWIGSNGQGLSSFDPYTERFTNYSTSNTKMISDVVATIGHDPVSGRLLIGTPEGLSSFIIGVSDNKEKDLNSVIAYPNPYYPNENPEDVIRIVNSDTKRISDANSLAFPDAAEECRIYDTGGDLVVVLPLSNQKIFTWDGTNEIGEECSSGIYFYVVSGDGEGTRGKIALIR